MRLQNISTTKTREPATVEASVERDEKSRVKGWFSTKEKPSRLSGEVSSWSKGQQYSRRLIVAACWVGLFLLWPIIFTVISGAFKHEVTAPVIESSSGIPVADQQVGAVAEAYVSSWLSATSTDEAGLSAYIDTNGLQLPATGFVFRDVSLASIGEKDSEGNALVQIVAQVKEIHLDADKKPVVTWPLRFFEISFSITSDGIAPRSFPRPVAAPSISPARLDVYGVQLPSNDPAWQSISSFLQAYATGSGDIARYVSPGTNITAILPAPYNSVQVQKVSAQTEAPTNAADGTTIVTRSEVQLITSSGPKVTATYDLVLKSRAGRWEVLSLSTPTTTPK